jgi:hypothetical protein
MQASTSWDVRSLVTVPSFVMMVGVTLFVFLVPIIKLLRRTGHHAFSCLLAVVPRLNFIAFWIFAFKPWPTDRTSVNHRLKARSRSAVTSGANCLVKR